MEYVQRVFNKRKVATQTLSVEEKENAQTRLFRLLLQEQFAEEMKSVKAEKETPKTSQFCNFRTSLTMGDLIVPKAE